MGPSTRSPTTKGKDLRGEQHAFFCEADVLDVSPILKSHVCMGLEMGAGPTSEGLPVGPGWAVLSAQILQSLNTSTDLATTSTSMPVSSALVLPGSMC
jgi:hypothetical protein